MAIMLSVVLGLSMTSCGNDDEPDNDTNSSTASDHFVCLTYRVSLSQTWYDYFNIEVSYTDVLGKEHSEAISSDWTYQQLNIKSTEAGKDFAISVVAKPKSSDPTVEEGTAYKMSHDCSMLVETVDSNGNILKHNGYGSPSSMSVGGDAAIRYFSTEHTIFSTSYSL
jgi:hypothetical protein